MPLITAQLIPSWSFMEEFRSQNSSFKEQQEQEYDQRHGVRSLSPIPDNSDVWIASGEQPATGNVIRPAYTPRSYIVDTPSGQVRRNRQHLNIVPARHEPTDSTDSPTTDSTDSPTRDQIIIRSRSGTAIRPPDRLWSDPKKGRCGMVTIPVIYHVHVLLSNCLYTLMCCIQVYYCYLLAPTLNVRILMLLLLGSMFWV